MTVPIANSDGDTGTPSWLVSTRRVTDLDFFGWIAMGTPFALSRWGNGEWHSVFGRTEGRNKSGQHYDEELGRSLRRVLRNRPPYMMELKRWEKIFGNGVDKWLIEEGLDVLDWIEPDVLHKVSMKGRLDSVVQAIRQAPDFLAVGPEHLLRAQETLGFSELIQVPSTNAFDALTSIREKAVSAASRLPRGAVITLSASMAANILVDDLYRQFGDKLIILDVGSLWDPYAGVLSRSYMHRVFEPAPSLDLTPSLESIGRPKPQLSPDELKLLQWASDGKKFAVEFGIGGSTFCLVDFGVERIFSIESDPAWIQKIAEHEELAPHLASGRLQIHHADIGPTRKWGHPEDRSRLDDWPNYWREAWKQIVSTDVDLVFVDGRFRVACTLNAILQGSPDITIVVHDFWKRPKYEVLLKYLNCSCRADSLAVFFPKSDINLAALKNDLARYSTTSA